LHVSHRTVFLQKDRFPQSRTAAHKNKLEISGLLHSVVLQVQYRQILLERYLQLCAKMLGSSEQRSGNTDALGRKPRGKHFSKQGANTVSGVM